MIGKFWFCINTCLFRLRRSIQQRQLSLFRPSLNVSGSDYFGTSTMAKEKSLSDGCMMPAFSHSSNCWLINSFCLVLERYGLVLNSLASGFNVILCA